MALEYRKLVGYVAMYMAENAVDVNTLAGKLHMHPTTLRGKLKDPRRWTMDELVKFFKIAKLNNDQIAECMRG